MSAKHSLRLYSDWLPRREALDLYYLMNLGRRRCGRRTALAPDHMLQPKRLPESKAERAAVAKTIARSLPPKLSALISPIESPRVRGNPISPNNVLRRWVFPACAELGLPNASWLTFRRTYASWAHERGVPGRFLAELMGHEKVDTSVNVYSQVNRRRQARGGAASRRRIETELFTIVHARQGTQEPAL
jgi:integrase